MFAAADQGKNRMQEADRIKRGGHAQPDYAHFCHGRIGTSTSEIQVYRGCLGVAVVREFTWVMAESKDAECADLRTEEFAGHAGRGPVLQGTPRSDSVRGPEAEADGSGRDPPVCGTFRAGGAVGR